MAGDNKKVNHQKRIYSPDISEYYANCIQISTSVNDFSLNFGCSRITEGADKSINVQEIFERRIYLSPQQAKALSRVLTEQVKGYEENFGEVNLAPKKNK